jgi:uncharacterized protein (DUF2237 family)
MESESNVLGGDLAACSMDPTTGFMRDGYCYPLQRDPGRHEICAVMTEEFLQYSKTQGNDLITPRPDLDFPGLEPGDHWCLCVPRWIEAHEADKAPPVVLEATSEDVLDDVSLETLQEYAHDSGD